MYMMQSQAKPVPFGKEPGSFTYVAGNRHVCTQRKVWTARASEAGFTILELIVSITILTLVALIIGQGFRIGVNSWDKGEEETLETQKLRILSGMLSQQLKSFYLYKTMLDDDRSNAVLFKGEDDSILFVTSLTDVSAGGLKWVRYSYKDGVLYYKEGLLPDKEVMDNLEGDEEILHQGLVQGPPQRMSIRSAAQLQANSAVVRQHPVVIRAWLHDLAWRCHQLTINRMANRGCQELSISLHGGHQFIAKSKDDKRQLRERLAPKFRYS